jgi:CspA family cold shock protein
MLGDIKWFSDVKKYGFISPDDGGPDIFVHESALGDLPEILDGVRVQFDVVPSTKKSGQVCASNVNLAK